LLHQTLPSAGIRNDIAMKFAVFLQIQDATNTAPLTVTDTKPNISNVAYNRLNSKKPIIVWMAADATANLSSVRDGSGGKTVEQITDIKQIEKLLSSIPLPLKKQEVTETASGSKLKYTPKAQSMNDNGNG